MKKSYMELSYEEKFGKKGSYDENDPIYVKLLCNYLDLHGSSYRVTIKGLSELTGTDVVHYLPEGLCIFNPDEPTSIWFKVFKCDDKKGNKDIPWRALGFETLSESQIKKQRL